MSLLIVASYVVLIGLIIFLAWKIISDRQGNYFEVRDNILAPEELQKYAIEMARKHPVGKSARSLHWLTRRLHDNYSIISGVYKALNNDIKESFPTAPAAEWLLDNFYIIEEQVRLIRKNLARGHCSRLPVLKKGYLKGYPRVYAIALELVAHSAHSNGRIDEKMLVDFINSYQSQVLLSMGELWALPLMLRIALVDSIRNVCERIDFSRQEWHRADKIEAQIKINESDTQRISEILNTEIGRNKEVSSSFVEYLLRKLRKHGNCLSTVTALLDKRLHEANTSTEAVIGLEHQMQAEMLVLIGNSITGLRLISDLDWTEIFESLSKVEKILRTDPCGIYTQMDFESRDHYRHEVEKLARAFRISEIIVAEKAVECAAKDMERSPQNHVGYYLVGKGRKILLNALSNTTRKRWILSIAAVRKPVNVYFGLIIAITAFTTSYLAYYSFTQSRTRPAAWIVPVVLLTIIPCSEIAISLVNTVITRIYKPALLPKLELKEGIPEELASIVIIPTLLPNPARAEELIDQLEVYYLANRDKNLFFALVGDFKDADAETQDNDELIIRKALDKIKELNKKYSSGDRDIFYYLNRKRVFNKYQNRWMGWERKRGAIVEFNKLVRGSADTSFTIVSGDVSRLPHIKYVITLDADTNLPMGTAKRLIGTMAHPLNRAVIDETTGIVSEGHGLLQPRISISIPGANRSLFTKIFAGLGGIDPYTTAVSDVYQDIFDEGIFTGKGIYDLDIFRKVLEDRIPDNSVLSHDLIEGCHLRAALVSDIELIDGYPARYNSYSARQHRWVRGDWQLIPWLAGKVRNREGKLIRNNLSGLSKWKIFDNLRRSLLYPSLLLLFFAGLAFLPGSRLLWTGFVLFVAASPLFTGIFSTLISGSLRFKNSKNNTTSMTGLKAALCQSLLLFAFLPHQAILMLDAIIRTLYRMFISHKNMLEWVTAADAEAGAKNDLEAFFRKMWFSEAAAIIAILLSIANFGESLVITVPAIILWLTAPLVAYIISKPLKKKQEKLSENDMTMLRMTARKTWRYFEDFAVESDNYLPPDNFQEDPPKGAAHRTSPTNIGLYLLSILSACDMGYIGLTEMAERLGKVLDTIERLDKWKGHLYNWYNTVTLETMRPLYVSTVDSGNFIGYMMVTKEGVAEYIRSTIPATSSASGVMDTLRLVEEEEGVSASDGINLALEELCNGCCMDLKKWESVLKEIKAWIDSLGMPAGRNKNEWRNKLAGMVDEYLAELYFFYPVLSKPEIINVLNKLDESLADSMLKPDSPENLLSKYTSALNLPDNEHKDDVGLKEACENIRALLDFCYSLIERMARLIDATEFRPLFDNKRQLFSIGYNAEDGHLSKSYYDLLASEARQASYIAIARNEVDRRHWVRLGRKLTTTDGYKGLVSWTGTMFEYLMPLLIMKNYENTIFDETYTFVVRAQKKHGKQHRVPWGFSESGFSAFDFNLNYQYKAFGVPELGLKRGLANDIVTSPYSSMLALGIDPVSAVSNLKELKQLGMDSRWGFYEAIDFTPSRLDKNTNSRIVKSFMAHHQGMSLAALNNFFNDNILQQRFHNIPVIKSAELLLQEKIPEKALYAKEYKDESAVIFRKNEQSEGEAIRTFGVPATLPPKAHILSNGSYCVMLTDGGSGYSRDEGIAITRWTGDYFKKSGFYIFIQNINSNMAWSATYDPVNREPDKYKVVFMPDKAVFTRRDGNIESQLEIAVSPEDNAEIRRISITNHSEHIRTVELTSYFEVVLSPPNEDAAHPAFSKLFVKTEFVKEHECLLASRRFRKREKKPLWIVHTMAVDNGNIVGDIQYETDRMKFIGRNRDITNPEALEPDRPLSNSTGSVLDPVMSLRKRIRIDPGNTVHAVFAVAVAQSRKHAIELADKYNDYSVSETVFELARTRSQVENRYLGLKASDTEFYLELLPFILYSNSLKREYAGYITENTCSQADLWPFGISGDCPIILVEVNESEDMDLVYWALKGHEYWRMKGLIIDLVFLINKKEGYSQPLSDQVRNAITASHARELMDKCGGVYIRNSAVMDSDKIALFYTAARLVVKDSIDSLKNSILKSTYANSNGKLARTSEKPEIDQRIIVHYPHPERKLHFDNGLGGFSPDGREYVIRIGEDRRTPAPWSNIISGRKFGFLVTESGGGYTWANNSREYKLTPWANDPVSDYPGEVFYIKDNEEGCMWSITPMPSGDKEPYTVRHGLGYTVFEHMSYGLEQSLTMFVPVESTVKVCIISLKNLTGKKRDLSVTYYIRPVLGVDEERTSPYIITQKGNNGTLLIQNRFTGDYKENVAFICTNAAEYAVTGDRLSFFGINGSLSSPEAVLTGSFREITGAGLDPCAAICGRVVLQPEEEQTMVFLLGSANSVTEAEQLAGHFRETTVAKEELNRVKQFWKEKVEAIQVHTPDESFDIMLNGWLLYQVISCRLWARSAYYQAGGAYGFRDQLQDSMAVVNIWPELTREQILLHASRQYKEGDVQHWWHKEDGKGIRTKYSDDMLWLAYVTAEYIEKTGDISILKEQVPFLESEELKPDEDERYEKPVCSESIAGLYEHCVLAIDRSLRTGPHGLPLMGGGDWNDGMNTVGIEGKGESVWLGWFLISILKKFRPLCQAMGDMERVKKYQEQIKTLQENIEREAWDGSWYRRAYFDNGMPLGSVQNTECKIDSIPQSWSIISGAAMPRRMHEAMNAVLKYLVDSNEGIIKLLAPPFDEGDLHPGYIKGYVPGVRENGGQYTHAATWVVLAFARLGMGDKAVQLFNMLNPINHTRTPIEYSRYKCEPYVLAADVYAAHPYEGRGGWTWYTGAAGWFYKVGLEYITGFRKKGNKLYIDPCIPRSWTSFKLVYNSGSSIYHIEVKNPDGVCRGVAYITIDGRPCTGRVINLDDDAGNHYVEVILGHNEGLPESEAEN